MWRHRQCQRTLKQAVCLAAIAGFLLAVFLKPGLYNILLSGLQGPAKLEDDFKLEKMMVSPAPGEYRLENPHKSDFSRGQSKIIDDLLGEKMDGFFVDIGAGDGETNSVSLFFEMNRKWNGVLVESNKTRHHLSVVKNRQAQLWNFRIRIKKEDTIDLGSDVRPDRLFEMINRPVIDLLIVNINGLEMEFFRQIDFAKYDIRVITIELRSDVSREEYMELTTFLASRGFEAAHHVINGLLGKKDVIYKKKV